MDHFLIFLVRAVTVLFFIGLIGCVPVVVLSWVLILKDEFVSPVKPPVAEAKR